MVWLVAAALLWRTRVPDNLRLPHLDPHDYFGRRVLGRASHFDRGERRLWVGGTLTQLVVLAAVALFGRRIAAGFELGRVGTGVMVGTFVTLMLWLAGLPFGFLGLWWERRYGLSSQSYDAWAFEQWPSLLAQVVGLTILLTVLMLLAGRFPRSWWLIAAPLLVAVTAGLVVVLALAARIDVHPIRNAAVAADVRKLERKEGVSGTPVRIETVSDHTTAINGETVGLGSTTIVVLWDTLFKSGLSRRAIDFVAAHELGHVARRHLWKGVGWSVLFTFPLLFLVAEATRRRGGFGLPEVVPFGLLVISVLGLLVTPLGNVISRRYEAEADWMALRATRDPSAAREAFHRFTSGDLAQPTSPLWAYVMLDDHPTVMQRLAMTRTWERRNR